MVEIEMVEELKHTRVELNRTSPFPIANLQKIATHLQSSLIHYKVSDFHAPEKKLLV